MLVSTQSGTPYAVALRAVVFAGSATVALGLLGSSVVMAQNCGDLTLRGTQIATGIIFPIGSGLSGGLAISGAVSAANTAFLTESTAFVSAPTNPKPGSEGSGFGFVGLAAR